MNNTLDLFILPGNSIQLLAAYSLRIKKINKDQFSLLFCLRYPVVN